MNDKTKFVPPKNKNDMTSVLHNLIKNKKVGVFIDSANLYYAANKASLKIDYFQVSRWFKAHCNLTSLNFYTAYDPLDERQSEFFKDLEKSSYTLIKKPIRVFADSVKGNMDIELAVDVLMNQDKYETLVLISGDGDFQRLIQALDQLGKKTIILGVGGFTSYELHQEADNYFFLNRIQEVWKKPRQRALGSKQVALPSKVSKDDEEDTVHEKTSKQAARKVVPKPSSPSSRLPKAPSTRSASSKQTKEIKKTKDTEVSRTGSSNKSTAKPSTPSRPKETNRSDNALPRVKVKLDKESKPKIILD